MMILSAFLVIFSLFLSHHSITAIQIKIDQGILDGLTSKSRNGQEYYSFYSIPYAKPPIGELRFEPPKDADRWEGVRNAKEQPPACIQTDPLSWYGSFVSGQEDCLYLNVFTSKVTSSSSMPVMVYIHGGAFNSGSSSEYGPQYFMDHPIVVVTIQYRLGVFGFLSAADLILPGNNGMKDQVAALKWVQKNIAAFGGDPKRVTIVGESAGSACVHFHLHSPLSTGLFHQAVMHSGSSLGSWALTKSQAARDRAHAFGILTGCTNLETKALVECLKKVPATQLAEARNKFIVYDTTPVISFSPVVESKDVPNAFLVTSPWNQSVVNAVPLIAGVNKDEGGLLATRILSLPTVLDGWNSDYDRLFSLAFYYTDEKNSSAISASIRKFYFGSDDIDSKTGDKLSKMFMDGYILTCTLEAARRHNNKVYFYLYSHRNNHTFNEFFGNLTEDQGVCHVDDLISFFNMTPTIPPVTDGPDFTVSQRLLNYWVNFLQTGDPNGKEKIWQPFAKNFEYLRITTDSDKMEEKLFYDRYKFWLNIPHP